MSSSNKVINVAYILIIVALLTACAYTNDSRDVVRSEESSVYTKIANPPVGYGVFRVHDPEMDVYCWIYESRGGIDCIPAKELE